MRDADLVVGRLRAWLVDDCTVAYPAASVFPDADASASPLADVLTPDGGVPMTHHCLLVRAPERLVLVDAGYGQADGDAPTGHLEARLRELGVAPDDVDVVVVTHAHGDHVGGLLRGGEPAFARARHLVPRLEWTHWTGEAAGGTGTAATVERFLRPLHQAGLVDLVDDGAEVADGVVLRAAPGHTPGHAVVALAGGDGERALYLADAVLHDLHVAHPDWVSEFDHDREQAVATRRRLLDEVAGTDVVVAASHMATTGQVARDDAGLRLAR